MCYSIEIWKPIPDCPPYSVSNLGRVRGYYGLMSFGCSGRSREYASVNLYPSPRKKMIKYLVHRLVAEMFVHNPDPEFKNTVNHINNDRGNNIASNLEWASWEDQAAWKLDRANISIDREGYARDRRTGAYV